MAKHGAVVDDPPAETDSRRAGTPTRRSRSDNRLAVMLIFPSLLALAVICVYPIIQAVVRSLFNDPVGEPATFIGFDNYARALGGSGSEEFWSAVGTTFFFAGTTLVLEIGIGLAMALMMNHAFRGRGFVRAVFLLPWAIPTAVSGVLWRWILAPEGIFNHLLGSDIVWTGSEWPSRWAIVMADTWKTAPFVALLLLAGLQMIPRELYESANVDGANWWRKFTSITLPLLRPALVVAVLFRMLDALRIYDLPQILTAGANDTTTVSMLVVQNAIGGLKPGYGGALSTLTFVLVFICAFGFIKLFGARVFSADPGAQSR